MEDLISTYEVEDWPFSFPGPDTFISSPYDSSTYEVEEGGGVWVQKKAGLFLNPAFDF